MAQNEVPKIVWTNDMFGLFPLYKASVTYKLTCFPCITFVMCIQCY